MRAEDIQEQLQALRDDVRRMGKSMNRVKEEDVRWVFGEQIRPILLQKVRRGFDDAVKSGMSGRTSNAFESSLYDLIERVISIYQRFDSRQSLEVLDQGMEDMKARFKPVEGDHVDIILKDLDGQLRQYLTTSEILDRNIEVGPGKGILEAPQPVTAVNVENFLSPLASAVRYDLMVTLKVRERGLTELSKALNLQKGHLQFHVKTLVSAEYIALDRSTRQYYLTRKGEMALVGLDDLIRLIQTASL